MQIKTRIFGEVTIDDSKMIKFPNGIVGFPDLTDFALIHDAEQGDQAGIRWLQSVQEPTFAMPVVDPLIAKEDYNPLVDDNLLKVIGEGENILVLVTITVPSDLSKMSVNLKAPLVVNVDTRKAVQVVLEDDYPVKFFIYDILKSRKENSADKK
ncbi:MAG: flagellar assembly protein FliW [Lachnospiraceae bacterium]|jgi:flagellar assembly factor FliW|nr:flagellar assembly factor FliW [Lachnospiraceae bacterium XPB1003]